MTGDTTVDRYIWPSAPRVDRNSKYENYLKYSTAATVLHGILLISIPNWVKSSQMYFIKCILQVFILRTVFSIKSRKKSHLSHFPRDAVSDFEPIRSTFLFFNMYGTTWSTNQRIRLRYNYWRHVDNGIPTSHLMTYLGVNTNLLSLQFYLHLFQVTTIHSIYLYRRRLDTV